MLAAALVIARASRVAAQQATPTRDSVWRTSVGLDYEYDHFGDIQAWQLGALSLAQRADAGTIIGRISTASRFGATGSQYEADAYPRLGGHGVYAYLNLGYSAAAIFPRWRSGAEIYTNLPNAYEASIGYRQLRFAGTTPLTLFTGTVGKYAGNYWFSLRPYVADKSTGTSASATLTARRYFAGADDYVGARIGHGSTPSDHLAPEELARTSSTSADVQASRTLAPRIIGTGTLGYESEQLSPGATRRRWQMSAGLRYDF